MLIREKTYHEKVITISVSFEIFLIGFLTNVRWNLICTKSVLEQNIVRIDMILKSIYNHVIELPISALSQIVKQYQQTNI